jgi:hypothetical protein
MAFDVNNNYTGTFYGKDRLGFTTPSPDASDALRPWLCNPYPAPWLPRKRRDEGHPVGANVVLSDGHLVGLDSSGALIPAGYISGTQPASGSGGNFCMVVYSQDDVGFTYNAATGNPVQAAGEYVLLACPSNAVPGTIVEGTAITANDISFAKACTLVPGNTARGIGYVVRNVFQYLGGVQVNSTTGGMNYTLLPSQPAMYRVHNYMHEPGTAVQTKYVLRLPWVGATPDTITSLAATDGVAGYAGMTDFAKSFVHFTGTAGNAAGNLFPGCFVVPSIGNGYRDAGCYAPFNPAIHSIDNVVGKVIGVETMIPIRDYADRVRTQFDRANSFVGPFKDSNPSSLMMGGSATRGMDVAINLATNGVFRLANDQGKTLHNEYGTYVYVHVNC